jgi:hypothetical protein
MGAEQKAQEVWLRLTPFPMTGILKNLVALVVY